MTRTGKVALIVAVQILTLVLGLILFGPDAVSITLKTYLTIRGVILGMMLCWMWGDK